MMSKKTVKRSEQFKRRGRAVRAHLVLFAMGCQVPDGWAQVSQGGEATLETVHVTASAIKQGYMSELSIAGKEPLTPREIANSVSVITEQRIRDQNLKTVDQALNQVNGVTVISNDSSQSQYYSRGYGLGVSFDGIPAYRGLSGTQQLDLAVYEQVEVLRGPAGIFAGSGEPGGVVNLVRKRAKANFQASASASAASWTNKAGEVDVGGALNEKKTVRARAVLSATNRDYFYATSHTNKWLAYATLDWDIAPSTTASFAATYQRDDTRASYSGLPAWSTGGLMNAPRQTNVLPAWNKSTWSTNDYVVELDHRFAREWVAKVKLNRREQGQYFKDAFAWTGVNPANNTLSYRRRIADYAYTRDAVDLYANGPFTLFGRQHRALFGYNYEKYHYNYVGYGLGMQRDIVPDVPFGRPDLVPELNAAYGNGGENDTQQAGLYGQLRLSIAEPLSLVLGGRQSRFNDRSRSAAPDLPSDWSQGAKEDRHFTPYAAAIYDINRIFSVYASYASIFIPQTNLAVGGATLKPREGRQFELGSKAEFFDGKLQASAAFFELRDKNRAFAVGDGYYLNAGEVQSRGWELEVAGRPAQGYEIQAGYARLDTTYLKDKNNAGLPFDTWEPRHTLKFWGLRHVGAGVGELSVGLGVNVVSASQAGNGAQALRRQGGYAVGNALLAYQVGSNVAVQFNVNNLFDRCYYTRLGGTNTYNSYGEPRNVALTARVKF